MVGAITAGLSITISSGLAMYLRKKLVSLTGIVAEKADMTTSFGRRAAILSTSARKPKSRVISASSMTKFLTWSKSRIFLSAKSKSRPGVAITNWGLFCSNLAICRSRSLPPARWAMAMFKPELSRSWRATR